MKEKLKWLIVSLARAALDPRARRAARWLALLLAGAALEQVTRLGLLPADLAAQLRLALSALS